MLKCDEHEGTDEQCATLKYEGPGQTHPGACDSCLAAEEKEADEREALRREAEEKEAEKKEAEEKEA